MANKRLINKRHAEQMRLYRERLKAKAKVDENGEPKSRGAPETRAVIQGLAVAVRKLAAAARDKPDSPAAAVYVTLMKVAHKSLVRSGFDPAESYSRLTFYVLPDGPKSKRRRAEIEERYWEQPPTSGIRRPAPSES